VAAGSADLRAADAAARPVDVAARLAQAVPVRPLRRRRRRPVRLPDPLVRLPRLGLAVPLPGLVRVRLPKADALDVAAAVAAGATVRRLPASRR